MTGYVRNIVNNQDVIPDSILIKGATILSMDESVGNIERGDILISGSTITAIGENLEANGARIINATNMIAMPGMVDSHRHSWEGQLRRINPNATCLEDYSNATHFSFAKYYRPADMYIGNLLTALGCIDAGITTVIDNSHNSRTAAHSDAAVEALLDAGSVPYTPPAHRYRGNGTRLIGRVTGNACKRNISRTTQRAWFPLLSWPSWSLHCGPRLAGWDCRSSLNSLVLLWRLSWSHCIGAVCSARTIFSITVRHCQMRDGRSCEKPVSG